MRKLWMQSDYRKAIEACKTVRELFKLAVEPGSIVVEDFIRTEDLYQVFETLEGKRRPVGIYIAIGGILYEENGKPSCYRQEYPQCLIHEKAFHILEMESEAIESKKGYSIEHLEIISHELQ